MENAKDLLVKTGKLRLKVTPKAKTEGIGGLQTDAEGAVYLPVKVRAVPEDGKTNAAVIALIAKQFGVPKSRLEIQRGSASRYKVIAYTA